MMTKTRECAPECAEDIFCGVNTTAEVKEASDLERCNLHGSWENEVDIEVV